MKQKARSHVGSAADIATLVGGAIAFLTCEVALWNAAFKRGQASEAKKARLEAERRAHAETDAEVKRLRQKIAELEARLAARRPKRRQTLR